MFNLIFLNLVLSSSSLCLSVSYFIARCFGHEGLSHRLRLMSV